MDIEKNKAEDFAERKKTADDSRALDFVYDYKSSSSRKWASFWMLAVDFICALMSAILFFSFKKTGTSNSLRASQIVGLVFSLTSWDIVQAVRYRPQAQEVTTFNVVGNTVYSNSYVTGGSSVISQIVTFIFVPVVFVAETVANACTLVFWIAISASITDRMFAMKTRFLFVAVGIMLLLRFYVNKHESTHDNAPLTIIMSLVIVQFVFTFLFNICYTEKSSETRRLHQSYPRMAYNQQKYTITINCYYNFTVW